jgi:hypothetical protein
MGLAFMNVKEAQANLYKTITWTKKSRKGKHEWEKAYIESKKQH